MAYRLLSSAFQASLRPAANYSRLGFRQAATKAVVLDTTLKLEIRDVEVDEPLTEHDLRIDIAKVGICGSDVHYFKTGNWPPYFMHDEMILGHEASGIVTEVGSALKEQFQVGDRVCMEPGVPDFTSAETLAGRYNVCRQVRFWATPPAKFANTINTPDSPWKNGHGCLRPSVVHPGAFTFKLPDNVPLEWGALAEPLAVGMHACTKASIKPGETAVVCGAGPIGLLTAMVAAASGCSQVIITDIAKNKTRLDVAASLSPGVIKPLIIDDNTNDTIKDMTEGGANIVFECAGSTDAAEAAVHFAAPGGRVLLIGCAIGDPAMSLGEIQTKELTLMGVFRYTNVFPKAVALMASGKLDLDKIITSRYSFDESVTAFEKAKAGDQDTIKAMITVNPDYPNLVE